MAWESTEPEVATSCPVCGVASRRIFGENQEHMLAICPDCRHVFFAKLPDPDELSRYYEILYSEESWQAETEGGNLEYYRSHAVELARYVGKRAKEIAIADIGCSSPGFLEQAVRCGFGLAIGVDHGANAGIVGIDQKIPMLESDVFDHDVPDQSLDILRYSHSLEHLPDPQKHFKAHLSKLKPGGLVYITQPNFPVFRPDIESLDLRGADWPYYLHFFSPTSLKRFVENNDLKVDRFFTVGNEGAALERYRTVMDLDHARVALEALAEMGEPIRGELNGYPWYVGENSALYAFAPKEGEGVQPEKAPDLAALSERLLVVATDAARSRVSKPDGDSSEMRSAAASGPRNVCDIRNSNGETPAEPKTGERLIEGQTIETREIETCLSLAPKCAFILGYGRSGTTILTEIINASPQAFLTAEANFFAQGSQAKFRSRYNHQHFSFNNQISKSTYAPNFGGKGENAWWEWLAEGARYFRIIGDKMAFSDYAFQNSDAESVMEFFESRFYDSRYIFIIRDPIQTILSASRIFNVDVKSQLRGWVQFVRMWADFIRIFPHCLTLSYEELSEGGVATLGKFLEVDLTEASKLWDPREARVHALDADDTFLVRYEPKIRALHHRVREAIAMTPSLRQADQKRRRDLNDVSSSSNAAETAVVPNALGAAWLLAAELLEDIAGAFGPGEGEI